jgi:hypothetical protein
MLLAKYHFKRSGRLGNPSVLITLQPLEQGFSAVLPTAAATSMATTTVTTITSAKNFLRQNFRFQVSVTTVGSL